MSRITRQQSPVTAGEGVKRDFFEGQREAALAEADRLRAGERRYILWRSVIFVLAVLALAGGYDGARPLWGAGALLLVCFAVLVRRHGRLRRQQLLLQGRLRALEWYLARWRGEWQEASPDGSEFLSEDSPQAVDLHLLGRASCFQYLCCARTRLGREALAGALSPVPPARGEILARQQAVRELTERPELCLALAAAGQGLPEGDDLRPLLQGLGEEQRELLPAQVASPLRFILPGALLLSVVFSAGGILPWQLPALLVMLQFGLALLAMRAHQEALAPLAPLERGLQAYGEVFALVEGQHFASPHLQKLAEKLRQGQAAASLGELADLADSVLARRNLLLFFLGNALLLWDSHLTARFLKWRRRSGSQLSGWLASWGELEVLLSLGAVALTREQYVFPEVVEEGAPLLQGEGITSLLLPEGRAVANAADFRGESCIITGSNMSGKTTYLRTLGGAAVLAYAGAPVCARSFRISPMGVFTSIQVTDDLSQGISTFYAELLRVRQMVEAAEGGAPLFLCIDEIFKGTNSADRIVGARAAIERLTRPHILMLVTTHDFELCELKDRAGKPLRNFHFEEHYEEGRIRFDFIMRPGPCRTRNAKYLLGMAGILDFDN